MSSIYNVKKERDSNLNGQVHLSVCFSNRQREREIDKKTYSYISFVIYSRTKLLLSHPFASFHIFSLSHTPPVAAEIFLPSSLTVSGGSHSPFLAPLLSYFFPSLQ